MGFSSFHPETVTDGIIVVVRPHLYAMAAVVRPHTAGMTLSKRTYQVCGLTGDLKQYNGMSTRVYRGAGPDGELLPTCTICVNRTTSLDLPIRYIRELTDFEYTIVEERYGDASQPVQTSLAPLTHPCTTPLSNASPHTRASHRHIALHSRRYP